ncbi:hypothetical protein EMCRGX_G000015 [Ephydatia muelleri]
MWYLEFSDVRKELVIMNGENKLMIDVKGDQKCVGPVVDVRSFQKDGKEYVVFQTIPGTPRPKGLDITAFNSAANPMCRKFEKADTSKKFCKVWKEEVMPLLRDPRSKRQLLDVSRSDELDTSACEPHLAVHNGDCAEGNSRLETGDDCRKRSSREAELDVPHSSIDARDDCRKRSSREAEVDVQHSSTERDGCQKHSSVESELDFKHSKIDDAVKDGYLGKKMNKAGIKGFQFKGLRGLTPSDVLNILQMVEKGELKLNEVNGYSHDLKVLEKIKESFIQRVGAKDWGDAKERFKEFTSEKNLSALFGKKFNPEAASFIDYCSRAAKHNCQTERTEANANAAFIWSKERGNMAAIYTTEMTSLSVEDTSKLPQFDGFALSFITLDGPNCTVTDIVRALRQHNTAMNRYAYTIVCFQPVDCIHRISEELKEMQLTVQVAYCSKSVNSKGK